jgi:hypothetical protein
MATLLALCIGLEILIMITYYVKYVSPKYSFRRIRAESLDSTQAEYYEVYRGDRRLTCQNVLDDMGRSAFVEALRSFLNDLNPFTQNAFYYLLFTPFQANFMNRPFTIVLLKNENEYGVPTDADYSKYSEYVAQQCKSYDNRVMSFQSKENDALLVCPCPSKGNTSENYAHIGKFFKHSTATERLSLFRKIQFEVRLHLLTTQGTSGIPVFVSTHGLDVPWLHFRLESPLPKHYTAQKVWYDQMP